MAEENKKPRRLCSGPKFKIGDHVLVSRDQKSFVLATVLDIGIDPVGHGQECYCVRINQSFAGWGEQGKVGERFMIPIGLEGILVR